MFPVPRQRHRTALSLSGPRECGSEITPDAATITSPLCPRLFSGLPEHKRPISKGMSPLLAAPGIPALPAGSGGCSSIPGCGAAGSTELGTAMGGHGGHPDMELNGHSPQFPGLSHSRVQEMKGCSQRITHSGIGGSPEAADPVCCTFLRILGQHNPPAASPGSPAHTWKVLTGFMAVTVPAPCLSLPARCHPPALLSLAQIPQEPFSSESREHFQPFHWAAFPPRFLPKRGFWVWF